MRGRLLSRTHVHPAAGLFSSHSRLAGLSYAILVRFCSAWTEVPLFYFRVWFAANDPKLLIN